MTNSSNNLTSLGPNPQIIPFRSYRQDGMLIAGEYAYVSREIFINSYFRDYVSDFVYLINHEMLHFILSIFVEHATSVCLDNIAEFGSEL
jgi:hypothetical protein